MKFGYEHDLDDEGVADTATEQTSLLNNGSQVQPGNLGLPERSIEDVSAKRSTPLQNASPSQAEESMSTTVADSDEVEHDDQEKPLPRKQIALLCFARICEPIAFFSIFPFVNQMCVRNSDIPPSDTGFYSGLIESLFSLTQMLVMIVWGRMADRFGRKPVLVVSLVGVAFATTLFGFAQTIWQMILFRCLAGVFSASVVTIRTMIAELSTSKTQARAFSWFAVAGNLGIFLGPLLGGALADPAQQYGGAFAKTRFFHHYPYALATIVTGVIALTAAILTAVFTEETLVREKRANPRKNEDQEAEPLLDGNISKPPATDSMWSLLRSPGVIAVLYLSVHLNVLAFSYTAIVPVFWYEPVELGGFGFSSAWISIFMCLTGAAQAIWLLLIFPPLQRRTGTGGVLRGCGRVYPFFFLCCPLLNLLLRQDSHTSRVVFWVTAPVLLALGVGVSMSFTAIQLAINDICPTRQTLGTLNAIALTTASGIRAIIPAAFTSLFAIGVRNQILKGYLAWVVMIAIAAGFNVALRWLPAKAEGKTDDNGDTVEVS